MLSGKVRWREVALFVLVPAASLAVLGLSAVGRAEGAAQREVAAMVTAAAERATFALSRAFEQRKGSRRDGVSREVPKQRGGRGRAP